MKKLAIKTIFSHVAIAIISTIVFSVIITFSLIYMGRNEYADFCKTSSRYVASEVSNNLSQKSIKNVDNIKVGNLLSNEDYYYFTLQDSPILIQKSMFAKNLATSNLYIKTNSGKVYWVIKTPFSKKSDFAQIVAPIVLNKKTVANVIIEPYLKETKALNRYMQRMMFSGFLFTMLFALVLSLIFEVRLIGPMSALRNNINNIRLTGKINWKQVNSKDEISEINDELKEITKKMQEVNQSQIEFFQNTSHELKTPLMSISGYAEAIRDGVMEKGEEIDALNIIIDESNKLSQAISSILYLSSFDGPSKYNYKEVKRINFYESVEELALKSVDVQSGKIEIINNFPMALSVELEVEKYNKLLNNILGNALRYAKSKIYCDLIIKDKDFIFTIRDDGPGFKNGEEDKVFERFYKGEGGHNGLGLSIVKKIVEAYEGEVRAYNHKDGGAVIELRFNDFYRYFMV